MIESYYCSDCNRCYPVADIRVSIQEISFNRIAQEYSCIADLYCPTCGRLLVIRWDVLNTLDNEKTPENPFSRDG